MLIGQDLVSWCSMARFAVRVQDHGTRARLELHGMDVGTPQKKGLKHSMGHLIYYSSSCLEKMEERVCCLKRGSGGEGWIRQEAWQEQEGKEESSSQMGLSPSGE